MALTKEERETIEETKETVITLKTVLLGVNGDEGLVGELKMVKTNVNTLFSKHHSLTKKFWVLVAILVASGVISVNLLGLFGG